jgi:hypothetical protein
MFEKHHEKKLAKQYKHNLAEWQELHDSSADSMNVARIFNGDTMATLIATSQ